MAKSINILLFLFVFSTFGIASCTGSKGGGGGEEAPAKPAGVTGVNGATNGGGSSAPSSQTISAKGKGQIASDTTVLTIPTGSFESQITIEVNAIDSVTAKEIIDASGSTTMIGKAVRITTFDGALDRVASVRPTIVAFQADASISKAVANGSAYVAIVDDSKGTVNKSFVTVTENMVKPNVLDESTVTISVPIMLTGAQTVSVVVHENGPPPGYTEQTSLSNGDLPASTSELITLSAAAPVVGGMAQLSPDLISGANIILGSQVASKDAVATTMAITEVDSVGHRACFNGDLKVFSTCPQPTFRVALDSNGAWSYSLQKNLLMSDSNYNIELAVINSDSQVISAENYNFHWSAQPSVSIQAATIVSVTSANTSGSYKVGDIIDIAVTFSEPVIVTGHPSLVFQSAQGGQASAVATYSMGSGSRILTFVYVVAAGDSAADLDYSSDHALVLGANDSIKTATDVAATLTLPPPGNAQSLGGGTTITVDGSAPHITSVTAITTISNGIAFKIGDVIDLAVTFSEPIAVTGTPQIALATSGTPAVAIYEPGVTAPNSSTLVFRYTIVAGQTAVDLDYQNTSALTVGGGGAISDVAGNAAILVLPAPGAAGSLGLNKDIVVDSVAPTILQVTSPSNNGTYTVGQTIAIEVQFSEAVSATGVPQLTLETGVSDYVASFSSAVNATTLSFSYTVQAGDVSADLDYTSTSALSLNGGSIKDTAGNNANVTLFAPGVAGSLGAQKAIIVDAVGPMVSQVTASNSNGTVMLGQTVTVQVVFSEAVLVTGVPQITLETGSVDHVINYSSGSSSTTLSFIYTVQAGDSASDLDYLSNSALALNGGAIKDSMGNDASLVLATPGQSGSLGFSKDIAIDASVLGAFTIIGPSAINSTTPTISWNASAGATQYDVVVSTTSNCSTAVYTSNNVVTTSKTTTAISAGTRYICITAKDNGSSSRVATNNAFPMVIDTTAPTVASVTSNTANGSYLGGAVIDVLVTFSEAVTVTGTPTIQLETGSVDQTLNYVSGSGTTLRFDYTVQSGNLSADLNYKATNSLALNGGTIKDAAGNNATLTLPSTASGNSLGGSKAIVIDAVIPTITNVTSTQANATYGLGAVIDVRVTFSEVVNVVGTPTMVLETGAVDQTINYNSGSASTILIFNYTVQAEDYSMDLSYVGPNSLSASSASIRDAAGNDATLTLPALASDSSLVRNRDIKINAISILPGAFSISSVQVVGNNSLLVTWNAASGQGIAYTVKYGTTSGSYPTVPSTTATSPFTISNLTLGSQYFVMVTAVNTVGSVNATSEQSATPSAFWVSAGRDRSEKASVTLTGMYLGGTSLAWTKTSGSGNISFGSPTAATTTVSADADGTYVLRLTNTDSATQLEVFDEMTLIWNTSSPSFTSLGLTSIASDGTLDRVEARAPTNLITALSASNYQAAEYLLIDNSFNCNAYPSTYYRPDVPVGFDTYGFAANDYKVCVQLFGNSGNSTYGETAPFTRATILPAADPHTVKSISAGEDFACVILENNTVRCWGYNNSGQLGYNDTVNRGDNLGEFAALPTVNLGVNRTAKKLVSGATHTCAILDDDTLKCWGASSYAGNGTGTTYGNSTGSGAMANLPIVNLGVGRTAKNITASKIHTCVLLDNNAIKCWGTGTTGALGYDDGTSRGTSAASMTNLPEVFLGTNRTAKAVEAGSSTFGSHTCAILDTDEVKCWGYNLYGQLGLDDSANRGDSAGEMANLPIVNLGAGRTAKALSLQHIGYGTCAILDTDAVKCWGFSIGYDRSAYVGKAVGDMATLGDVILGAGRSAKSLTSGSGFVCAVLDNNTVKCWGDSSYGQLGGKDLENKGDASGDMAALDIVNLGVGRTAKAVSSKGVFTCAILDTDAVKCWGQSATGALGNDSTRAHGGVAGGVASTPAVDIGAGRTVKKMSLGGTYMCVLLDTDEAKCWGNNWYGVLGYSDGITRGDDAGEMASLPVLDFGNSHKIKDIAAGVSHTCAILDNDQLKCWGSNLLGKLGLDDTQNRSANLPALPSVNLGMNRSAKKVGVSDNNTCVILDTDEVKCWGAGGGGLLGKDATADIGKNAGDMASLTPINLGTGRTAKSLAVGDSYACVILDDSSVKCWGGGGSQLGLGDAVSRGRVAGDMANLPVVNVGTGRRALKIDTGVNSTCAILDDSALKCWGVGTHGNLGGGSSSTVGNAAGHMAALLPVNLGAGRIAVDVKAGDFHTCVLLDDGNVKCVGRGEQGELGYDDRFSRGKTAQSMTDLTPVNFGAGRTANQIETGLNYSCAVLDDQTLHCWGINDYGNLGYDDKHVRGGGVPLSGTAELYFP